jgi:phosphoribosylaminoimidazole carboxylase PurE protein
MTPSVSVLMGSSSDEEVMKVAVETLRDLGVECDMRVLSAHRTPDALRDWVREATGRGVKVFICGAGGAAHLAGAVAAHTTRPVIGVPLSTRNAVAGGLDALLSTVQMPRGIPVATVAIGEPGAANAGILAAEILATGDDELAGRLRAMRESMAAKLLGR